MEMELVSWNLPKWITSANFDGCKQNVILKRFFSRCKVYSIVLEESLLGHFYSWLSCNEVEFAKNTSQKAVQYGLKTGIFRKKTHPKHDITV